MKTGDKVMLETLVGAPWFGALKSTVRIPATVVGTPHNGVIMVCIQKEYRDPEDVDGLVEVSLDDVITQEELDNEA